MKRMLVYSAIVFSITALASISKVSTQNVVTEIKFGEKSVSLSTQDIQKAREAIRAETARDFTSAKKSVRTKSGADRCEKVERLVNQYGLGEKSSKNPHLAFGSNQISDWCKKGLDETDLRLEFAARMIILEAADKQNVPIRDQDMLTQAAQKVITQLNGQSKNDPPTKQTQTPSVSNLICEGDTSEVVIKQGWEALDASKGEVGISNLEKALACSKEAIDTWTSQANEQQAKRLQSGDCKLPPNPQDKEAYFRSYWALSDVAAAWFIRGQVFAKQQKWAEAREAYKVIVDKYPCAYIWDPKGWFWRTAEGAERESRRISAR